MDTFCKLIRMTKLTVLFVLGVMSIKIHATIFIPIKMPNETSSFVSNISKDGKTVVGFGFDVNGKTRAYRWTEKNGVHFLTKGDINSEAIAVNNSGIIIGYLKSKNGKKIFKWQKNQENLALLTLGNGVDTVPVWVNDNCKIIIGNRSNNKGKTEAFIWTEKAGKGAINPIVKSHVESEAVYANDSASNIVVNASNRLGNITAYNIINSKRIINLGTLKGSSSYALSGNKNHIVGRSFLQNNLEEHAFLWSSKTGLQDLGTLGGKFSAATGVDFKGNIVVGYSEDTQGEMKAFIWFAGRGMHSLKDYLLTIGVDNVADWELLNVIGLSEDGSVIVGNGINPEGVSGAWVVQLEK